MRDYAGGVSILCVAGILVSAAAESPAYAALDALCPDDSGAELRRRGLQSLALLRNSEVLKSSGARKSLFTGWPVRYVKRSSFRQP